MKINLKPTYVVFIAETLQESSQLAVLSYQLEERQKQHAYLTFDTLELPLMEIKQIKKKGIKNGEYKG